jgi:hypothetical protein
MLKQFRGTGLSYLLVRAPAIGISFFAPGTLQHHPISANLDDFFYNCASSLLCNC